MMQAPTVQSLNIFQSMLIFILLMNVQPCNSTHRAGNYANCISKLIRFSDMWRGILLLGAFGAYDDHGGSTLD